MKFLKNPKVVVPAIVAIAALAWLAFGYFAVHTLFIDDKVNEAAPTFAPQTTPAPEVSTAATTPTTIVPVVTTVTPTVLATVPQPQIVTEAMGTFVSLDHDTSGTAAVLGDGSGRRFLRFENFETDNGPDLKVYLVNSSTGDVSDYIDLGELKGNIGDQNYEIPVGADLSVYDKVVIWCVRFSSPFGEAPLQPASS